MTQAEIAWKNLESIRKQAPLVHNITNYVVMNTTANALLSLGASPVMAHAKEEVEAMSTVAGALVINIGTLSPHWVEAMELAMAAAAKSGTVIVLDPVGAGATQYRTDTVLELMEKNAPDLIRGNASEIGALVSSDIQTKGVDSTRESHSVLETAGHLAENYDCTVVVSGEVDYIISSDEYRAIRNGSSLMAKVTGMGCTASALVGAFAAVNDNRLEAAASAMGVMGVVGEMASEIADGPGTLQLLFLDTLHRIRKADLVERLNSDELHD